ncbi:MAG: hypothetical protein GTO41_26180 [Burkholderiales bacterium]|nr:hypothetical protein [Burkholderiales bacterium]
MKSTAKLRKPAAVKDAKLWKEVCDLRNSINGLTESDGKIIEILCHWWEVFKEARKEGDHKTAATATDKYLKVAAELQITPAERTGIPANATEANGKKPEKAYFKLVQ